MGTREQLMSIKAGEGVVAVCATVIKFEQVLLILTI